LARAVIGGLLFATFATLIFVPAMYRLLRTQPVASGGPAGEGELALAGVTTGDPDIRGVRPHDAAVARTTHGDGAADRRPDGKEHL
jgi:hypothetical protein